MSYVEKDFAACQFNPMVNGSILKVYPVLYDAVSPQFATEPLLDQIVRYIIMVYDSKSPLVFAERDLNYRKGIAAELSGLTTPNGDVDVQAIYDFSNPIAIDFVMRWLMRFSKSKEWAAICAFEYKFWEGVKILMQPITGKTDKEQLEAAQKKDVIANSVDESIKRLDIYYKNFLGDDTELEKKAKKKFTPEGYALGR